MVLTILVNLIPRLFPKATQKAERELQQKLEEAFAEKEDGSRPRMKVFFPWKTMLIVSVLLTLLANFGVFFR